MRLLKIMTATTMVSSLVLFLLFMWNLNGILLMLFPADIKPNLPKFGAPNTNASYHAMIQLHKEGRGFCSAFVIDGNYAITAAHCLRDGAFLSDTPIQIHDRYGRDTKIVGQGVAISNRIDIGLVKADFRSFYAYRVDFYNFTPTNNPGVYEACGFPGLQNQITCTKFAPSHNVGFHIAGKGFLIPGMSGGPVYDLKNQVVIGVNSSAANGFVIAAPVMGMLGMFGIEP